VRRTLLVVVFAMSLWLAPGALAAGWCGSGETAADRADVITGRQVHAVVAVPSDGPDTFAADANRLADDVTSLLTWWQGQDPTRVPRFDQATFGAASCLDISLVRLPYPASLFAGGASTAFARIEGDLAGADLSNVYKKYLVYFEGPATQADVCGTGAGDFDRGPAYAVVWHQGCGDVPTDSIGTHELLHALGALPDGAPHACTLADGGAGHPCDSPTDVLYPYTTGAPLAQEVLDFGHDDYYAHSGTWIDIQDSPWLHRLDLPQLALTVRLKGAGEIQSDVPGVDCSVSCRTYWDAGSQIALTALPDDSDRFVRWTGACTGTGDCAVSLTQAVSAVAVFGPLRIPVRVSAAGNGRIACTPSCGKSFSAGAPLKLRAVAAKGWRFAGWSGVCKGKRVTCAPPTDFALNARATFRKLRKR
jgi:hypothetical protein